MVGLEELFDIFDGYVSFSIFTMTLYIPISTYN